MMTSYKSGSSSISKGANRQSWEVEGDISWKNKLEISVVEVKVAEIVGCILGKWEWNVEVWPEKLALCDGLGIVIWFANW